ncbi:MAG TPA: condensation domain-containing protein, partial [Longimicrobiaceae bacterium]|nr:condensation domain-containing protein [Longimicrobiaceae bacterium]
MPVGPGSIQDIWPLSPLQEEILFHTLAAPGSGAHVVQSRFTLSGRLDADAFERAWQGAVDRHAVLRTAFAWEDLEEPVQVVLRSLPVAVAHQDWRGLPPVEQRERMAELLRRDRERGFDPARAPLMRLQLVRLADEVHEFVWTRHHVLLDGWSDPLVFGDVVALYVAGVRGEEAQLPPTRPYGDYVAWIGRRDMAAAEAFWRGELRGVEGPTRLELGPGDGRGYAGEEVRLVGPAAAALSAWIRRAGLTPGTVVHGAWALLLARCAGTDGVVFGSVASGRPAELEGADRMVGLFINTLPVRLRVPEGERVEAWLRGVQASQARSREWEHASPARVRAWSGLAPGTPLWESLLVFQNYPVDPALRSATVPGLRLERGPDAEQPGYPLMLSASLGDELVLRATFDRAHFSAAAVRRALGHLRALLRAMAAGPERRLGELEMLDAEERAQLVAGWNATAAPYPRERCLHERFEEQAAADPGAVALLRGEERITRGELDRRANRLAHHLRALGAGPEVRVGVCLERSPESVAAVLAVLKAGAAYVPLDPDYPAERLEHVLRDSGARLLVTTGALAGRVGAPG